MTKDQNDSQQVGDTVNEIKEAMKDKSRSYTRPKVYGYRPRWLRMQHQQRED